MRRFLADPGACAHPGNPVIADLVYGWGNDAWSALDEFLSACIVHASAARGPILECGSGLSTILVGAVAKMRGQRHWALEHAPKWAKRVRRCLRRYKLESVVLWAPLRDYGSFCWYDPPPESMPDSFSLVVCDGPPASTKGGRSGLAEVMRERLEPGCVILLDDAARPQDLAMARRWEAEIGASIKVLGTTKPYVRMTLVGVPEGHAPDHEGAAVGARRVRHTV